MNVRNLAWFGLLVLVACGDDEPSPGVDAGPPEADGGGGVIGLDGGGIRAVDVLGTHAGIRVAWTLGGVEASQQVCRSFGANGAAEVQLVVTNDSGATLNLMDELPDDFLSARCSGGGYADIDPRFASGRFEMFLQAVDRDGELAGTSEIFRVDTAGAAAGDIVDIGVIDIMASAPFTPLGEDASISLSWTINSMEPTAELCQSARNMEGLSWTHTRLLLVSRIDPEQQEIISTTPCEEGSYDSRPEQVLRAGSFGGNVQLLSGETVLAETGLFPVAVPLEGHVVILDMPLNIDLM